MFFKRSRKTYSYEAERQCECANLPISAAPYKHLAPYLTCWMDSQSAFAGKRILDIGAGEAAYARFIAERYAPASITAMDLFAQRMMPTARASGSPNLNFVAGDAFSLPFQNGAFEVVRGNGILSRLPGLERVLAEIRRVLSAGGLYVGFEPNPFNAVILYRYFLKWDSPNAYLYWPTKVRSTFEQSGFDVNTRYFYARWPRARSRFIGTCVGTIARKR